jgi:glycosyltransferase involved in cell wall biosynthesis
MLACMRVLLISPGNYAHANELYYSGRFSPWARGLSKLGHEVTILTTRAGLREVIKVKTSSGFEVIALPKHSFPFLFNFAKYWTHLTALHYDVVHYFNWYPNIGSLLVASILKVSRGSVLIEDVTDAWFAASKGAALYAKFSSKVPDHFTPMTEELRELYSTCGLPLHKSTVVPSAADTERIRSLDKEKARNELGIKRDIFLLGFEWGTLATPLYDTVLFLFYALRKIIEKFPQATLAFIGNFSRYRNMIVELAKRFDVENIIFSGLCSSRELSYWLSACDVLLLPQGNNLFEYLAAGRPIVVNASSVTVPIVIQKGCGLVARTNDPEDFAAKIIQLLMDEDLRHRMSVCARSLALNEFSCESVAKKLEGVYKSLLEKC